MSIDYSYSNEDAAAGMGLFDQYDAGTIPGHPGTHGAGWAKSILDKMLKDEQAKQPSNPNQSNPWKSTDYPQDEQDVWNWYFDDVVPIDKWNALVKDFRTNGGKNIKFDPYSGSSHPFANPSGGITPPDVSAYKGGNDNTNGDLKVSTEAIKYFANQIDKVAAKDGTGTLMDAAKKFDTLNVRPGKFYKAEVMRQAIAGTGAPGASNPGLIGDTQGLLKHLHSTLVSLSEDLVTLATTYDKAEDFNHLTAQGLAKDMDKSWGSITGIDDFGNFGEGSGSGSGK